MGARAFHDLDGEPIAAEKDPYASNRKAFVRDVTGEDEAETNLPKAIDSFVLAGALKLHREANGVDLSTKHHTMLIHSSVRTDDHARLKRLASDLFDGAGFETVAGATRLEELLETDFRPVAASRGDGLPFPSDWEKLRPFVGEAIGRIRDGEGPVIVVNGTDEGQDPDFDRTSVWKIVVGGAKLSRGYTVEGLTTSYFRRRTGTGDALMQMGRWFGYRENYIDLVRLFVSREEQFGARGRGYDLYEAFEAVCRDEEAFRAQLQRYALPEDESQPPLTPIDVVPLVYSHLSWLPPVANNKRANAVISWENYGGKWAEPTLAPVEADRIEANAALFEQVLEECELKPVRLSAAGASFGALVADLSPAQLLYLVDGYSWAGTTRPVVRLSEFLGGSGEKDPGIDRWILIAPQLRQVGRVPNWRAAGAEFTVKYRSRSPEGRVKAYSEPLHRMVAEEIVLPRRLVDGVQEMRAPRTGVALFYPTHHQRSEDPVPSDLVPTMGFALLSPPNHIRKQVIFTPQVTGEEPFL